MSNIRKALEKAKQARSENNPSLFQVPSGAGLSVFQNPLNDKEPVGKAIAIEPALVTKEADPVKNVRPSMREGAVDVQVVYSKTRVHAVDHAILKKNKLVALFPDMESIEEIKILRTQVLNKLTEIEGNTILVTSANAGEGKTFTCINLGISISQELDRTVLIIDADLRNHNKRHFNFAKDFLNINNDTGLSDYLLHKCELSDLLMNPGIDKLTVIPAGKPLTNAAELLGSNRMEKLVAEVKERYKDRIIIIDGPAALDFPDPILMSKYVDGVLMVVEVEKTTSEQVLELTKLFENTTLIGAVTNKAK